MESFAELLRAFRERVGLSCTTLALQAHCDPSYVIRLQREERNPPRWDIAEALADTLNLTVSERNRFLLSAGLAPASLVQAGDWPAAVQAVCDVLNCPGLSAAEQDAFCTIVIAMAKQWVPGAKVSASRSDEVPAPWYGTPAAMHNGRAARALAGHTGEG